MTTSTESSKKVSISSTHTACVRNPILVALLTIITFGIYGIIWYYLINRELAALGSMHVTDELGDNPVVSLAAVTIGSFVLVPPFVSHFKTAGRVAAAQRAVGADSSVNETLALVLVFFLYVGYPFYVQSELNKVWIALRA